jgi:hypothetical protein
MNAGATTGQHESQQREHDDELEQRHTSRPSVGNLRRRWLTLCPWLRRRQLSAAMRGGRTRGVSGDASGRIEITVEMALRSCPHRDGPSRYSATRFRTTARGDATGAFVSVLRSARESRSVPDMAAHLDRFRSRGHW